MGAGCSAHGRLELNIQGPRQAMSCKVNMALNVHRNHKAY